MNSNSTVESDITVYLAWLEHIKEVKINVEAPKCGLTTETSLIMQTSSNKYDWQSQTNTPVVTLENPEKFGDDFMAYWIVEKDNNYDPYDPYIGSFTAGENYKVGIKEIAAKFPYVFADETEFYVNGEKITANENSGVYNHNIIMLAAPARTAAESIRHYDYGWATADIAGEHDWGEWETIEEPSSEKPGLRRRVCNGDPAHIEEEEIPPTGAEPDEPIDEPDLPEINTYYFTDDSQNTYTVGSGKNLEMTVKADRNNSQAFTRFTGIKIDDKNVDEANYGANYDAANDSVRLSLHTDYLDKLSVGEHSITVLFDDGEAEYTFTVAKKDVVTPTDKPVDNPTVPTGDNESNALWFLLLIVSLGILCSVTVLVGQKYKAKYYRK